MDWLKSIVKMIDKEGLPLIWTTSVCFPVLQRYNSFKKDRITAKLGDSSIKLTVQTEIEKIDSKRIISSISPNFIHSLDAAHLMLSVNYALIN